ncbi:MAG: hypothetical protein J2O48_02580 [Solirubrobacterales bacterium]|nr:hypothetical protein [Solirubrobacterales bacterium]
MPADTTDSSATLTAPARELADREAIIERNLAEVGAQLREIRDKRLYRDRYSTFEEYCQQRWSMDRRNANRQIEAAEVVGSIDPSLPRPANVAVTRELAPLHREDPKRAQKVWAEVVEEHGPKPTARQVREHVQVASEPAPEPRKENRRPLPDAFRDATLDLTRRVNTLTNLAADDRFPSNRERVTFHRSDLTRARDALEAVIDQIDANLSKSTATELRCPDCRRRKIKRALRDGKQPERIYEVRLKLMKLVGDIEWEPFPEYSADADQGQLAELLEELELAQVWIGQQIAATRAAMGDASQARKLIELQKRVNDATSTPNERQAAARAAERLARRNGEPTT